MSVLSSLLARRLVLVTGKGGTGKSTVSVLLAQAAAALGLRTLIVELNGAASVPALFGRAAEPYQVIDLGERLSCLSVGASAALEEFVSRQLHSKTLFRIVFRNRLIGPFIDAVPGLPEVIQLGKVQDLLLEQAPGAAGGARYDLVVLDAPSTGHGLTLLDAPGAMLELTRVGPIHHHTKALQELLCDPASTAIVLTTLPESMPVQELIELYASLGERQRQVRLCVLNQCWPPLLDTEPALTTVENIACERLVLRWRERLDRQAEHRARVGAALPTPLLELPFLFHRGPDHREIQALAPLIEALS